MATLRLQPPEDGHDLRFNGIVKLAAILRPVVEASAHPVGIGHVVREPGIEGDLVSDADQFIEERIKTIRLLDSATGHRFPGLFTHSSIGVFLKAPHGHERLLLAPKFHRQAAAELVVFVAHLGVFGLQGDIFRTIQFHLEGRSAIKDLILCPRQLRPKRVLQEQLGHGKLARLERGIHHLHEMQVGLLSLGIVGMAGLGDVPTGPFFIESGGQFTGIQQPPFQLGHSGATGRSGFELIKEWSHSLPISQSQDCRHKASRAIGRQFSKGQKTHADKPWKPTPCFARLAGTGFSACALAQNFLA